MVTFADCSVSLTVEATFRYASFSESRYRSMILFQLKASRRAANDFDICVSGGLVLANVLKYFLFDVA